MLSKVANILFATDLTENSRRAFHYATGMAALCGARITILHVLEKLPAGVKQRLALMEGADELNKLREAHVSQVRNVLIGKRQADELIRKTLYECYGWSADAHALKTPVEISLVEGEVGELGEEILKASVTGECGLIVMGAHAGLFGTMSLGGVTKTVLHNSKVPVLIVPPEDR